jgi:hypothetical protein
MTNLVTLNNKLKEFTKLSTEARPFLCNGSPFGSDVFLVGINPATSTNFWNHWSIENGCNKKQWLEEYLINHNHKFGSTRKRIEIFFNSSAPLKILETNIFPFPSSRESELNPNLRNTQLFDYLIETIKPKLILAHGASAIKHLSKKYQVELEKGKFITLEKQKFDIRVENHFSYQWSYQAIKELALEVSKKYT